MSRRFTPTASYLLFLHQLIQARHDAGVTQDELAKRLDLSPAQVAKYELGERQLDFVQTREWCVALGVSFLDFMVKLDEEITAQLSQNELSDADAPDADAPEYDDPYGVGHHVLPHVPPAPDADAAAPDADPTEGGAK